MLKIEEKLVNKLVDMENACHEIQAVSLENSINEFLESSMLQHVVLRNIEIIGEAARGIIPFDHKLNKVIDEFGVLETYPEIPWKKMIGAREKSIHCYDGINFAMICGIMKSDIPELIDNINKIKEDYPVLSQMMDKANEDKIIRKNAHIEEVKKLYDQEQEGDCPSFPLP